MSRPALGRDGAGRGRAVTGPRRTGLSWWSRRDRRRGRGGRHRPDGRPCPDRGRHPGRPPPPVRHGVNRLRVHLSDVGLSTHLIGRGLTAAEMSGECPTCAVAGVSAPRESVNAAARRLVTADEPWRPSSTVRYGIPPRGPAAATC